MRFLEPLIHYLLQTVFDRGEGRSEEKRGNHDGRVRFLPGCGYEQLLQQSDGRRIKSRQDGRERHVNQRTIDNDVYIV